MASIALLALAPLMALIAIAIKIDSRGPVLFKQKQQGFNNELIDVYKFRSMYVHHADAEADKLVTKHDPRVTRVGRLLRKASLDELPQFFNVIKGDLSLVGPRPHALKAKAEEKLYADVVDGYFARHRVKPGVTRCTPVSGALRVRALQTNHSQPPWLKMTATTKCEAFILNCDGSPTTVR